MGLSIFIFELMHIFFLAWKLDKNFILTRAHLQINIIFSLQTLKVSTRISSNSDR